MFVISTVSEHQSSVPNFNASLASVSKNYRLHTLWVLIAATRKLCLL